MCESKVVKVTPGKNGTALAVLSHSTTTPTIGLALPLPRPQTPPRGLVHRPSPTATSPRPRRCGGFLATRPRLLCHGTKVPNCRAVARGLRRPWPQPAATIAPRCNRPPQRPPARPLWRVPVSSTPPAPLERRPSMPTRPLSACALKRPATPPTPRSAPTAATHKPPSVTINATCELYSAI
eukprot:1182689-Prorocentrum_minimum.AAC.3